MKKLKLLLFLFLLADGLFAQLKLSALFSDGMVFQQQVMAPVWGWATPGEKIVIRGSWASDAVETTTDVSGSWQLRISTPEAGGPYYMTINQDTLHEVLIGEVWICSGQSNMQFSLNEDKDATNEIPRADYPEIRFFYLARQLSDEPQKNCYAHWTSCTPETAKDFSAVAYYYGKNLYQHLDVPIGLIHTSWGGSPAQAWMSEEALQQDPDFDIYYQKQEKAERNAHAGKLPVNNQSPSAIYNAMIAPLIPFSIKGAIWYQGESNTWEAFLYETLFPALIKNWRKDWGQGNFPFYFVQIAPFNYNKPVIGALLRDAQRKSLSVPHTGMVVTLDIGNPEDIHPKNKKDVGSRLALLARARNYGESSLIDSGPLYQSIEIRGDTIRLFFDATDDGLMLRDDKPANFEIAGSDRIFYPAKVKTDANTLMLSSPEVKNPLAARYAFHNTDEASLFNQAGLPASSFRTDDWNIVTQSVILSGEPDKQNQGILIQMETGDGFTIHYSTDGSDPDILSSLYQKSFLMDQSGTIKARAYQEGIPSVAIVELDFIKHLALSKHLNYQTPYSDRFPANGEGALVDGLRGSAAYNDGQWQGFRGNDINVIIDLEQEQAISRISTGFLQHQDLWILFPDQIVYLGSNDGLQFKKIGEVNNTIPNSEHGAILQDFTLDGLFVSYRYIQVKVPRLLLPQWHPGAGEDAWLFVDEIMVK